jgi:hypothetical protein
MTDVMEHDLHYYAFQYRNAHSIDASEAFKQLEAFVQSVKDERFDILWLRHEAGNNEYIKQNALLVRARNILSQPAHWGADDEQIKSRYALYTEIQEHLSGMSGEKK